MPQVKLEDMIYLSYNNSNKNISGSTGATTTIRTRTTTKDLQMPRVKREPSLTEKTQTWLEIRKAVPVMKRVGINPGEVKTTNSLNIFG